jgi:3-keto-5-aminohexanoate cleavage enzyme
MDKVMITAALTGSRPTKEMNPGVPYSPEEIAHSALECWRSGAAVVHIHVRDPETGAPSDDIHLFEEVTGRIRAETDLLINLTTSGLHIEGPDWLERRLAPVGLRPELCSLDVGSMNFPEKVFHNPPEWGVAAAARMKAAGVKPEIEVFEAGHIEQAKHLIRGGLIDSPPYFQLCMGVRWGMPPTSEGLSLMMDLLPQGAIWSVLGVGRAQLPMITLAMRHGGHVRVGFEDNLYLERGRLAKSNAQFVERAVALARELGREVATPEEARSMLGIGGAKAGSVRPPAGNPAR